MQQRNTYLLFFIIALAALAGWVVTPDFPGIHIDFAGIRFDQDIRVHEGLTSRVASRWSSRPRRRREPR